MGNLDFVAIDLETATSHRNSICEIGIVKNSIVIESKLIRLSLKPWGIALKFLFLHHENILFPND